MDTTPDNNGGQTQAEGQPNRRNPFHVLRHKHFATIWGAAAFSFLGNWFEFVGTQWIVAEATKSTEWLAWIGAAQLTPTLFFGLLGGVVADRVNRKTLLIVTQLAMMLIAIGFAIAVFTNHATPQVLLMLALAQGITTAFNAPAWQVLTPRLVPREDLVDAITLQGISFNVARAVGPAIGGLLMGFSGAGLLFAVNAVSFIVVLAAVLTTPDAPAKRPADGSSLWDFGSIVRDTKESLRFVWNHKGARAATLACVVFALLATPVLRFLPLFVKDVYNKEEAAFGVLTGIMGVGAVVGGLTLKLVPAWYPKHHFIPVSVTLGGLWIFVFSITTNYALACGAMFFVGAFWMWAFNSSMTALQMLVTDELRGRVMAVCNTAALGLMPLGAFLASWVANLSEAWIHRHRPSLWDEGLNAQLGVAFVSLVLMGAGVVMLIWRTPEVDGISPDSPNYDRKPGLMRGITARAHRPPPNQQTI
jgi:MFS family permease